MSMSTLGSSGHAAKTTDRKYIDIVTSRTCDPLQFGEIVEQRNRTYRTFTCEKIEREIARILPERERQREIVITEHGSAGRNEKGNSSKIDIIVSGITAETVRYVAECLGSGPIKDLFLEIDERPFGESSVLYFDTERKLAFPCRTIDSANLFKLPSSNLGCNSKKRLLIELDSELKRVLEHIKNRKRAFKKVINNNGVQIFRGNEYRHFDLDEGTMMYEGDSKNVASFKLSALRFAQNAIVHDVIKFTGDPRFTAEMFENLPQNTAEKLLFIADYGIAQLTNQEVEELIRLYQYFLWLYHKSQYAFKKSGETTIPIPDSQLTRENLRDLLKILEKGVIKF